MTKLNDTAIDQIYGLNKDMPEHPRKGQYAFLHSADPNIDGAIVKIDRAFVDWAISTSVHALTYIRRLVRVVPHINTNGNVYQATVHLMAPQAHPSGPFRNQQAILVHESEIGEPYNGYKYSYYPNGRFTDEALRFHILNPHLCIFQNCLSEHIRSVGMSIRDDPKNRVLCEDCKGEWTQTLTVMGAY